MAQTSTGQEVGSLGDRVGVRVESCNIEFLGRALPIHLFRHFCYRTHRLAQYTSSQTEDGQRRESCQQLIILQCS